MAGPPCSDDPLRNSLPTPIPIVPPLFTTCGNFVPPPPPHPHKVCSSSQFWRHNNANPYTVCDRCHANVTCIYDQQPGPLQNILNLVSQESPGLGWQSVAEQTTGRLDATRRFPIDPGWLTRMCTECEDMIQAEHYFVSTAPPLAAPQGSHKWEQIPTPGVEMISCVCEWNMETDSADLRNPWTCLRHRGYKWTDLLQKRNETDTWLRNAMKLKASGKVVQAKDLEKRRRVMNGTFRACPCGRDVVPWISNAAAAAPQPPARVFYCMACGGYDCQVLPAVPTLPLTPAPGVVGSPPITRRQFDRKMSQWRRGLPAIGQTLSSR